MKKLAFYVTTVLVLFCLVLPSCSRGNDPSQAKESRKSVPEKAQDAIREYSSRPIEKARAAQQIGEERTEAIDEAMKQK